MRTMTMREFAQHEMLRLVNERLANEGRDIRVVAERPKPQLAAERGSIVELRDGTET
jgi:hypothetical protein